MFSLHKSRKILKHGCALYRKKSKKMGLALKEELETKLEALDRAVCGDNRKEADPLARAVATFLKTHFPKTFFDHVLEVVYALTFAIVIAFAIREMWFELYQVPTGSMRPTVEELDRLVVSKTTFGIHLPFQKGLLFYNNDRVKRNGIIVFTTKGMDIPDSDMLYFYLFPGKKRFIKRCCGKPGDSLYFYGGRIYGVDARGNPITEMADEKFLATYGLQNIDHIPYITFEGKTALSTPLAHGIYESTKISQMNLPTAKMKLERSGAITGSFFNGEEWVKGNPAALKKPHATPQCYADLWGIGNYAMARLLSPEQMQAFYGVQGDEGLLYLELHHTPNLTYPPPEMRRGETGNIHPMITPYVTTLPLNETHLSALMKNLYTSRFIVKDGKAFRYQEGRTRPQHQRLDVSLPGVPNGTYEFYYGQGYQVHFAGIMTKLSPDHPLYSLSAENIQTLFNLGVAFNRLFEPMEPLQPYNPQRFAYFREGDLYIMGAPILKKEDPTLLSFVEKELEKQKISSAREPYIAFVDHGPPTDLAFIQAFGLKIPEDGALALGDNYSMSADSRDFGFVPTENLRGAPSFTFWPPGSIGPLTQPPYPWITLPNLLVWSIVALIILALLLLSRERKKKGYFKKIV